MQGDRADFSRMDALSGKVDGILIGEGFVAPSIIERLAARVPVVVIAGNPTSPGERAADVVAADNFSGSAAIITPLITPPPPPTAGGACPPWTPRRTPPTRANAGGPWSTSCAAIPNASWSALRRAS